MNHTSTSRTPRIAQRTASLAVVVLLALGCSARDGATESPGEDAPSHGVADRAVPRAAELPGIEHFYRWSEHLGQGSQPEGDPSFAALADQGFVTVLSVDGALPDVDGAARHGLRYVHVPIGYDGIGPEQQLRIVKAVEESDGPVYVHCHHGLHRGPAAAAIARIAHDGVSADEAYHGLQQSGCSPNYKGLYRDVAAFELPDGDAIAALGPLPSAVRPDGVRGAMVAVDGIWGMLKHCKSAGWAAPAEHPDVEPSHEALMLQEQLREAARLEPSVQKGDEFVRRLGESERLAGELSAMIAAGTGAEALDAAYAALKQSCTDCHADYRD